MGFLKESFLLTLSQEAEVHPVHIRRQKVFGRAEEDELLAIFYINFSRFVNVVVFCSGWNIFFFDNIPLLFHLSLPSPLPSAALDVSPTLNISEDIL